MRFQIGGQGWPVNGGATLIPAGTIVEGEPPTWNHMILPLPLPIDATPLDDDAALEMLKWYEPGHWHRLRGGQDEGGIDGQHSTPPAPLRPIKELSQCPTPAEYTTQCRRY